MLHGIVLGWVVSLSSFNGSNNLPWIDGFPGHHAIVKQNCPEMDGYHLSSFQCGEVSNSRGCTVTVVYIVLMLRQKRDLCYAVSHYAETK